MEILPQDQGHTHGLTVGGITWDLKHSLGYWTL